MKRGNGEQGVRLGWGAIVTLQVWNDLRSTGRIPSIPELAAEMGRGERIVQRNLGQLREHGLLIPLGDHRGGRGRIGDYEVTSKARPFLEPDLGAIVRANRASTRPSVREKADA